MLILFCNCYDFQKNWDNIMDGLLVAKNHGWQFSADSILYCPWCSQRFVTEQAEAKNECPKSSSGRHVYSVGRSCIYCGNDFR